MEKDIHEVISDLQFGIKTDSYPILRNLKDIKDFNFTLEKEFEQKINALTKVKSEEPRSLTLQDIYDGSECRMYLSFQQVKRSSLLVMLCAVIENVFTHRIKTDRELNIKWKNLRGGNRNIIILAIELLNRNGYNFSGIDRTYVKNMSYIRNAFVHENGDVLDIETENHLNNLIREYKYDFKIKENRIELGSNFIGDYIKHLEVFSFEIAEKLYEDESWFKKYINENPQIKDTFDKIKALIK